MYQTPWILHAKSEYAKTIGSLLFFCLCHFFFSVWKIKTKHQIFSLLFFLFFNFLDRHEYFHTRKQHDCTYLSSYGSWLPARIGENWMVVFFPSFPFHWHFFRRKNDFHEKVSKKFFILIGQISSHLKWL